MAHLTKHNCSVDPSSGGIVFTGSPELRAIKQLQFDINRLSAKVDSLIDLLKGVNDNGRKMAPS